MYLPHYLSFDLNWQAFRGASFEVAQGLTLRHAPGHTPGLCIMQLDLTVRTWIFTTDMYLVKENYYDNHAQGFLMRDQYVHLPGLYPFALWLMIPSDDWCASNQSIHALVRRTDANIIFGHCNEVQHSIRMMSSSNFFQTLSQYKFAPEYYS